MLTNRIAKKLNSKSMNTRANEYRVVKTFVTRFLLLVLDYGVMTGPEKRRLAIVLLALSPGQQLNCSVLCPQLGAKLRFPSYCI